MTDFPRPPDDSTDDEALRESLAPLKGMRGPCPGGDRLYAFHCGELSSSETETVAKHVAACGYCEGFLALLAQQPDFDPPPQDWLNKAEDRVSVQPTHSARWWRWFWRPQPAYVLALAAIGIAIILPRGASRKEPSPSLPVGSIPGITLDLTRAATRDSAISLRGDLFFLSFPAPVSTGDLWSAEVVDAQSRSVLRMESVSSADSLGNFVLVLPASKFSRGEYLLKLHRSSRESSRKETFELPFSIR